MTVGSAAFWIYLSAYSSLGGATGLVLGLIARLTARPYDTPQRFRAFLGLLAGVASMGIVASALSYNLTSEAGAFTSFRVTSLVWPFIAGMVIFMWASGFPPSRIIHRRS